MRYYFDNSYKYERNMALLASRPQAVANIMGNSSHSGIKGSMRLFQLNNGVLAAVELFGLPAGNKCANPIFALHIHEGESCTGNSKDAFADAKMHYNPDKCDHPYHAGDLPPLFGNNGYAFQIFFTDRFTLREVIGKTVIVHSKPDDFKTQPSGDAGEKIACGVLRRN